MADRCNTNFLEILRCQFRQHVPIDLVPAKGWQIALKAQTLQPRLYVHAVILGSEESSSTCSEDIALSVALPAAAAKQTQRCTIGRSARGNQPFAGLRRSSEVDHAPIVLAFSGVVSRSVTVSAVIITASPGNRANDAHHITHVGKLGLAKAKEVRLAMDSPAEQAGFEPSVPL